MKQKFFIIAIVCSLAVVVFITRKVTAVEDTVESDYARDVVSGEQELKNDPEALRSSEEVDEAENPVAEVDHQEVISEEKVSPAEAVEPAQDLLPSDTEVTITPEPEPTNEPLPTETPVETPTP